MRANTELATPGWSPIGRATNSIGWATTRIVRSHGTDHLVPERSREEDRLKLEHAVEQLDRGESQLDDSASVRARGPVPKSSELAGNMTPL